MITMRIANYRTFKALITILICTAVSYTSCKNDACTNYTCFNSGTCVNGKCVCPSGFTGATCNELDSTAIVYHNNSFTTIRINFYTSTSTNADTIASGSSLTVKGIYGGQVSGSAYAYGIGYNGNIIGSEIEWPLNATFPSNGSFDVSFDVPSQYFFIKVVNNSSYVVQTLLVNSGMSGSANSYIYLPQGASLNAGYYVAGPNSTAELDASGKTWTFNSLNLPMTTNQSVTLTAN